MARRDSGPRRYAEAAFGVAQRDGTVETWRSELEAAAAVIRDLDGAEHPLSATWATRAVVLAFLRHFG